MSRIVDRFLKLNEEGRAGLVTFITAGDPEVKVSEEIFAGLPASGADIIELGMPFTDPMADGPAIELASQRALKAGQTMAKTFSMVKRFRENESQTPVVLMGYYNPIYAYGIEKFSKDASESGIDGVIIVDLPPEEEEEFLIPARAFGIEIIRLIAPTSDDARLPSLVNNASGFIYYVSVRGITGTKSADTKDVAKNLKRIKQYTDLPVVVGFGIKTPEQAAEIALCADGVVVGTAIVERIHNSLENVGSEKKDLVNEVLKFVSELAGGVRSARRKS